MSRVAYAHTDHLIAAPREHPTLSVCGRTAPLSFVPKASVLSGEISPGWELVSHLVVISERDEDGSHILSDDEFDVFGVGSSADDAKDDYIDSLLTYYQIVESHSSDNVHTRRLLGRLKEYLRRQTS